MPNWSDDEGRYWYTKPGAPWWSRVEIPHAPIGPPQEGCSCKCCRDHHLVGTGRSAPAAAAIPACGKYVGDNDATCPQLSCLRYAGHPGACDNVSADLVHFCDWAQQPDIRIRCDQSLTTPAWHDPVAPGVYAAEDGRLYAFDHDLVTCPDCSFAV